MPTFPKRPLRFPHSALRLVFECINCYKNCQPKRVVDSFFQDILKECREEGVNVDTDSQEQKDIVNERTQHTEVRFEYICRLVSFVGDICSFLSVNACIISLVNL